MTKNVNKRRAGSTKPVATIKPEAASERAAASESTRTKPPSKIEQVIALLGRPIGATLNEMVATTGWQSHTTRAALTGLKKKGHALGSEKINGVRRYRIGIQA